MLDLLIYTINVVSLLKIIILLKWKWSILKKILAMEIRRCILQNIRLIMIFIRFILIEFIIEKICLKLTNQANLIQRKFISIIIKM